MRKKIKIFTASLIAGVALFGLFNTQALQADVNCQDPNVMCGYKLGHVWHFDLSNNYLLDIILCCKSSSMSNACNKSGQDDKCDKLRLQSYYK